MKIFRIKIYLEIKVFIKALFKKKLNFIKIDKIILKQTNKNLITYTSQLRTGFLLILLFLKKKFKEKNEIIMMSYNLKEMVNIPLRLKLKLIFCDNNLHTGSIDMDQLKRKINKKTLCVVLSNIFSDYETCKKIKKICNNKKIPIIEDNAIYFDNYIQKDKRHFSGSFGDYTLLSFNIMKNISGLYGGCIAYNDENFYVHCEKYFKKKIKFNKILYFKQIIIFMILKIFSLRILYKYFFFYLFLYSGIKNIKFIQRVIYPSLKFRKRNIPDFYYSRISNFSKKLIFFQLTDLKMRAFNHLKRKLNNKYYYVKLKKLNSKNMILFKIKDFNFQNYLDFPVLFKNKDHLYKHLLKKGFDTKKVHYFNCAKTFNFKEKFPNSQRIENEILCLPNNSEIDRIFIDKLIKEIELFYDKK